MKIQYKDSQPVVDNIKTYVFEPLQPVTWQAGQFIHYALPHDKADDRGDERWFTISSAPFEKDIWITTRWFDDTASTFKKSLDQLAAGDVIEVDDPDGDFIETDADNNYVFVAGGIGITPFRSILTQLDHEGKPIHVELLYANRNEATIPFKAELEALSQKHQDFNITYFSGDNKIDEAVLRSFGEKLDDPHYYISGPEPMVEAFKTTLETIGIDESHVKLDYFPGYDGI